VEFSQASVRRLTILASLTGGLGTLVAAGIALAVLDRGIRPLDRLGRKVDEIDSASLEERLSSDELAEELQPFARRINGLLDRLEAGFERERRFGADLSHELRTPLAEIRATAEMAKLYPNRASPEDYESILETTDRLERIVESQLALARSGLERQEAEFETIDIAAMTREVLHSLDPEVRNRELTLDLHLPPERAFTSHHELLETILVNLIENAVHHAPAGSTIEVIVPPSPEASLFQVRNPAPDLGPEDIERLFERLWRKDASRKDRHHSGLGLSLARSCAEALGFTLDAVLDEGLLTMELTGPEGST
jgi:two-component system sensor histidine kinase QseC